MAATYPLVGEVVRPGTTFRDWFRPEGREPESFRARVVRPAGKRFPEGYWITEVVQCSNRAWMNMTVIMAEGHIYTMRTGRDPGWAGRSVEVAKPVPWIPKPPAPYGGLQRP